MAKLTALDVLKQTRELFAATHWTTGTLYSVVNGKKKFCMVGGLCHTFLKGTAPEWVEKNQEFPTFFPGNVVTWGDGPYLEVDYLPILEAELALAQVIDPGLPNDASPATVEDTIVGWNDGFKCRKEFEERGDASYVIEVMDEAIKRVESAQQN